MIAFFINYGAEVVTDLNLCWDYCCPVVYKRLERVAGGIMFLECLCICSRVHACILNKHC